MLFSIAIYWRLIITNQWFENNAELLSIAEYIVLGISYLFWHFFSDEFSNLNVRYSAGEDREAREDRKLYDIDLAGDDGEAVEFDITYRNNAAAASASHNVSSLQLMPVNSSDTMEGDLGSVKAFTSAANSKSTAGATSSSYNTMNNGGDDAEGGFVVVVSQLLSLPNKM